MKTKTVYRLPKILKIFSDSPCRVILSISIAAVLLTGCGGSIKWRPNIYVHDYENKLILDADNNKVACNSKEFNNYVSMSIDDLGELAFVVHNAKMPRKVRRKLKKIIKAYELSEIE